MSCLINGISFYLNSCNEGSWDWREADWENKADKCNKTDRPESGRDRQDTLCFEAIALGAETLLSASQTLEESLVYKKPINDFSKGSVFDELYLALKSICSLSLSFCLIPREWRCSIIFIMSVCAFLVCSDLGGWWFHNIKKKSTISLFLHRSCF